MLPELNGIRRARASLGLTQKALSEASGVSQSAIAKVEAGKLDPSYSSARKLFEALEALQKKGGKRARDVMNPHVLSARKGQKISLLIRLMRERGISQMPVLDAHRKLVGSISETGILQKIEEGPLKWGGAEVQEAMEEPFPTVGENTPAITIGHMLRDSLAVIVLNGGKIAGIITKSDMLRAV